MTSDLLTKPAERVFISYKRSCAHLARQLYVDLTRMGCTPWLDEQQIPVNALWKEALEDNMRIADTFLVLWSPEIEQHDRDMVWCEYQLAKQSILSERFSVLRIAGKEGDMPAEVSDRQHLDFTNDYWGALGRLAKRLGRSTPKNASDVFECAETFAIARQQLGGSDDIPWKTWPMHVDGPNKGIPKQLNFIAVPWMPSGYAMSWRVGERDASPKLADDLFIVLKFTAGKSRDTLRTTLAFLRSNDDEFVPKLSAKCPQFLYIEGPLSKAKEYELPDNKRHQWHDCVDLCVKSIEAMGGPRRHFFLEAPQSLTFPIATRLRSKTSIRVYNPSEEAGGTYRCVYDSMTAKEVAS